MLFCFIFLAFSVVNMANEVWEVYAGRLGHEIRVNINPDTVLWKYLSDLEGLWGAGQ